MFGENIRLRSINAERTRCLNYCRQTNRCRNDARLLTRAMWILNWRYGFHARSSLLQLAAFPRGGLTPAEAPLIDAEILFRQPQPPNLKAGSGHLLATQSNKFAISNSANMIANSSGNHSPSSPIHSHRRQLFPHVHKGHSTQ